MGQRPKVLVARQEAQEGVWGNPCEGFPRQAEAGEPPRAGRALFVVASISESPANLCTRSARKVSSTFLKVARLSLDAIAQFMLLRQ